MGVGKSKPKEQIELEEILKKNHGLFDIKIKVEIRDSEGLSLAYTPGVATPCLEIQKIFQEDMNLLTKQIVS